MARDLAVQFAAATKGLSVYCVTLGNTQVGRIVFKSSTSNWRSTCYVQLWGSAMVKGIASGYGYDKDSAALKAAMAQHCDASDPRALTHHTAIWKAVAARREGEQWYDCLVRAGYTVQCVI